MKNEEITFGIFPETQVIEYQGIQQGARLYAQASGLDIYVASEDSTRHPDCLNSMMLNACIARHIPTVSLHTTRAVRARSFRSKTETKEMF